MRMDMKRKTKKRILLYVIAAILVVCGIFAYQTNKRSAEKKAQKEAMKNQIKTIDDLDGKKIVLINDVRFKSRRNINWIEKRHTAFSLL